MQINRLFEIVYILLDQKCVTAAELSERFEVSVRTIYRDIETLSSAGIPVYMRKGKGGGISLLPGFTLNKTVLTASERENIVSSLRATQHLTKEQDSSALNKLGSLFGEMNTDWLEVDFSNWGDNGKEMDAFIRLKPAIIHRRVVRFSYASNKEEKTTRTVLPLKLVFKGQAWYLYGYCRLRKDYRFFKLRRIDELTVSDESFCMKIPENVLAEVKRVLKTGGTFLMGDCWQPLIGRAIMNFYMKHSNEGDVKIYSEQEIRFMFEKHFINVQWEQIGKTACIAWGEKSAL